VEKAGALSLRGSSTKFFAYEKKLQLQIPKPCHEDWNKMTPGDKGRFCDSCQKTVHDFTGMSDAQLVAFFKKPSTGSVCGRFYNDQLGRNLEIPGKRIPWLRYFFQIAIPAFLISSRAKAQGETRIVGDTVLCQSLKVMGKFATNNVKEVLDTSVIRGRVVEINGAPIPYSSIIIKGTTQGVMADENGEFRLRTLEGWQRMTLRITSVGFEEKEIIVTRSEFKKEYVVTLTMYNMGYISVGVIVTVRKPKPLLQRIFKDTTFKYFKVYPNPVVAGSSISIELKKAEPGEYETELINTGGQTVYSGVLTLQSKKENSSFKIPTTIPGSYSLLLTNKKTGKKHAEKIVVQ
jgi:CarboxypepD_reg-like domain